MPRGSTAAPDPWTDLWLTLHCLTDEDAAAGEATTAEPPSLQFTILKQGGDGVLRAFAESEYMCHTAVEKDLDVSDGRSVRLGGA